MDREITISLTDEQARILREHVSAGDFASEEDAVVAAVEATFGQQRHEWLSDDLLKRLVDEADAVPGEYTPDEIRKHMLDRHEQYIAEQARKSAR